MKATAVANSNIALTKYWGKRDSRLILPFAGSLSMTLDGMHTRTTVELASHRDRDTLVLNGVEITEGDEYQAVSRHLDLIRDMAGSTGSARVATENNFPTAAGLASSASGFAALSLAGAAASGLVLDSRELSILARRGSGSASRSIPGGLVVWHRDDSFAEQVAPPDHWDLCMIIAVTSRKEKKIKSRAGMMRSVANCPYFTQWIKECERDLETARRAVVERDFSLLGGTAERNCLKMHAVMMSTDPPILYWTSSTLSVMHAVQAWRSEGLECYFTIDGGPQVKILCESRNAENVKRRLDELGHAEETHLCRVGGPARLVDDHLF